MEQTFVNDQNFVQQLDQKLFGYKEEKQKEIDVTELTQIKQNTTGGFKSLKSNEQNLLIQTFSSTNTRKSIYKKLAQQQIILPAQPNLENKNNVQFGQVQLSKIESIQRIESKLNSQKNQNNIEFNNILQNSNDLHILEQALQKQKKLISRNRKLRKNLSINNEKLDDAKKQTIINKKEQINKKNTIENILTAVNSQRQLSNSFICEKSEEELRSSINIPEARNEIEQKQSSNNLLVKTNMNTKSNQQSNQLHGGTLRKEDIRELTFNNQIDYSKQNSPLERLESGLSRHQWLLPKIVNQNVFSQINIKKQFENIQIKSTSPFKNYQDMAKKMAQRYKFDKESTSSIEMEKTNENDKHVPDLYSPNKLINQNIISKKQIDDLMKDMRKLKRYDNKQKQVSQSLDLNSILASRNQMHQYKKEKVLLSIDQFGEASQRRIDKIQKEFLDFKRQMQNKSIQLPNPNYQYF